MKVKTSLSHAEAGIAHLGLILLLVIVLGGLGFAGYRVMNQNKQDKASTKASWVYEGNDSADAVDQTLLDDQADVDQADNQVNTEYLNEN